MTDAGVGQPMAAEEVKIRQAADQSYRELEGELPPGGAAVREVARRGACEDAGGAASGACGGLHSWRDGVAALTLKVVNRHGVGTKSLCPFLDSSPERNPPQGVLQRSGT